MKRSKSTQQKHKSKTQSITIGCAAALAIFADMGVIFAADVITDE